VVAVLAVVLPHQSVAFGNQTAPLLKQKSVRCSCEAGGDIHLFHNQLLYG
jgi:hypothetical protein